LWPSLVKVLEVLIHPPLRRHPFPTSKNNRVLGIFVLDVGGEHLLLPRHVVCASAVDNPA
jgi:hypothetical protein